jgi:hypothetical protein
MARPQRPTVEILDDRTLPAVYGMAWSDPMHLTLSFAPDGTPIAAHQSNLFQTLDAQEPRAVWEGDVLRALETWAANTNISVGVVADGGQPFGTPGLTQGDSRFGDIRIGAQAMSPDALAVSVPHDPFLSGRWAGDVFLNSAYNFTGPQANLYAVMLHEFGHGLGLDDSTDPSSVMYAHPAAPLTQLAPSDIAAIQALYGVPAPDPYQGHDTLATAARLRSGDDGSNGSAPLVTFGDLRAAGTANVFSVRTPQTYQGPVTVRLLTAGVSLLGPRLTVYDAAGNVLGQAQSTNLLGDVLSVQLSHTSPGAVYYVQVDGAAGGAFGVGRYGLAVTFDSLTTVTPAQVEAVLGGPFDTLNLGDVEGIFSNPQGVLFNDDGSGHSTFATAQALTTAPGYAAGTHYQAIGSLNDSAGGDFYSLTAPAGAAGTPVVLTATVGRMSVHGVDSRVELYDAQQHLVATTVLIAESGTFTIQAANLTPGATYYLKVSVAVGESENGGNYALVIDFQQPATLLPTFAAGTLSATQPSAGGTLYVAQNQLFHFVLSVPSPAAGNPGGTGSGTGDSGDGGDGSGGGAPAPAAAAVEVQVFDSKGHVAFDLKDSAGGTSSGTAFLVPGAYTVRITMPPGAPAGPTDYQLSCASLTDPVGPALADPSLQPLYTQPQDPLHYYYPGGIVAASAYYWLASALTSGGSGSSGSPGGSGGTVGAGSPGPATASDPVGAGSPGPTSAADQGAPPAPPQGPVAARGHGKRAVGSGGRGRRTGHGKKPTLGSRGRGRKPHHNAGRPPSLPGS